MRIMWQKLNWIGVVLVLLACGVTAQAGPLQYSGTFNNDGANYNAGTSGHLVARLRLSAIRSEPGYVNQRDVVGHWKLV